MPNASTMSPMTTPRALLTTSALCCLFAGEVFASKPSPKVPKGTKVVTGEAFDIYVIQKESRPFASTGWVLGIFESTVVVHHTRKHGRQLKGGRLEAIDADLRDPAMWQVGDFDGDGFPDFRFVAQVTKKGCRIWNTQTWLPDRERFTFAKHIAYQTDASGKPVKGCR